MIATVPMPQLFRAWVVTGFFGDGVVVRSENLFISVLSIASTLYRIIDRIDNIHDIRIGFSVIHIDNLNGTDLRIYQH